MSKSLRETDPDKFAALSAEAMTPFRNLRLFFYGGFGAWGAIGAFIFFFRILAGRDLSTAVPNFALQMGLVGAMGWLFLRESRAKEAAIADFKATMKATPAPKSKKSK
jgi:hypothetical protein